MGKRVVVSVSESQDALTTPARSIRKKKRSTLNSGTVGKALRLNAANNYWHENDDEDSSSNDAPASLGRVQSTKHANNSSILLNSSLDISINESPKPVYTLRPSLVNGTILHDLTQKPWRLGRPIGKGNFGEIFLASSDITVPVTNENAKFVVKIEPHSNGPLFVEIHCLMNTAKKSSEEESGLAEIPPSGIPDYIASGSHYFGDARYRFLVLQRFDRDLHSLIKNCRVSQKSVLTLAIQIVNVLEKLHDKGYCHNDVKAQNLMISKCKYYKKLQKIEATGKIKNGTSTTSKTKFMEQDDEKQQTTDSGNSSEQEPNDEEEVDYIKSKGRKYNKCGDIDEDYEDFDDDATSHSNNSNSMEIYETPVYKRKRRTRNAMVEFSGSNPVRSCRRQQRNSIYEEMVKSHYLRPAKRISYSEFFHEDTSVKGDTPDMQLISSDDESEEFLPQRNKRTSSKQKPFPSSASVRRLTRRQEKLSIPSVNQQHAHQTTPATNRLECTVAHLEPIEEERIVLIDFGLASKFMDNGVHRPFVMDQRRAHDGTLEFTSRDAHMGAHSRRSDLECLGYNLIFWSQGYLPWKEAATQHQQEKVHRAKEYLMTDVREMLKQIYGKQVPKFLGEFLHHVGQLAYHERPNYARYRRIFEREYQQLGYSLEDMALDRHEIVRNCVRFKEEIENKKDIFEMNKNVLSIMKNLTVGTPFHERTFSNRVSPKNLRSKSDKKAPKKKKFSWAEILSQDPDQIARERAEKEFDREDELSDMHHPAVRRYEGKPTYAILEIQQRMKMNGRLVVDDQKHGLLREMNRDINTAIQEEDDFKDSIQQEVDDETGNEEADENDTHDEEIESDVTEASEEQQPFHKNRRPKIVKSSLKKSSVDNSKSITTSTSRKSIVCKSRSSKTTSASTRTRSGTTIVIKTNAANSSKRGSATRNNRKSGGVVTNSQSAASAAGEIEQSETKYHNIDNGGSGAGVRTHGNSSERRTRRCLIKTDAEKVTEVEGNSNFSPDGSNNAAPASAKHCRK